MPYPLTPGNALAFLAICDGQQIPRRVSLPFLVECTTGQPFEFIAASAGLEPNLLVIGAVNQQKYRPVFVKALGFNPWA